MRISKHSGFRVSTILAMTVLILVARGALAATPAGTTTLVTGHATAATSSGEIRDLYRGGPVYGGEVILTSQGSYANILFTDGGRILLRPESRFLVARYQFAPAAGNAAAPGAPPEHESAFFRLLKGGFRAISGLIGHVRHEDYGVQTPVATIGIRGTDYEARLCQDDCSDITPLPKNGLYVGVANDQTCDDKKDPACDKKIRHNSIILTNGAGSLVLQAGQFAYVESWNTLPVLLSGRPPALGDTSLPDPLNCN